MTLQGYVQTHLPPTIEQPLVYKYPMSPVSVASVLNQTFSFPKQTVQTRQIEPTTSFEHSPL